MARKLLLLACSIFALLSSNVTTAKESSNGWNREGLKGKVKEIRAYSKNEYQSEALLDSVVKYNNKGNKTECTFYEENGDINMVSRYKYDGKGNCIEYTLCYANGRILQRRKFKYDDKANMTELIGLGADDNTIYFSTLYTYDSKGNKTTASTQRPSGEVVEKFLYTNQYDAKGNLIESQESWGNGEPRSKYVYKYDENGKLTEETKLLGDGTIGGNRSLYKYDDKGNKTEESLFESNGTNEWLIAKYTYVYDANGHLTERRSYDINSGQHNGGIYYQYDEKGNKTEEKGYALPSSNETFMVVVEYDYY